MYRPKPHAACHMPKAVPLTAIVLNASLKHEPTLSNTGELSEELLAELKKYDVSGKVIRLADKNIPVGLTFRESEDDDWPAIAAEIREADILILATPVWWGQRSSLMQRVIERIDAFDEEYHEKGRSALYNKVAGIVITGNEDGALHVMGSIMMVLSWLGLTLPPECTAYWVGEVGNPLEGDTKLRRANKATKAMVKNLARNLAYHARLLRHHPMEMEG
jgi:multimeric flavodoxin WrbA